MEFPRNKFDPDRMSAGERLTRVLRAFRDKVGFSIGKRLPPRKTRTERIGGDAVPICPRCGNFVYYRTQCVDCGQRFKGNTKTVGEVLDHDF